MNMSRTRSGVLTLRFHTDGCPATSTGVTGGEGHARAASHIRLRGRVVKQPVRIARLDEAALGSGEGQFGVTPTRASADPMLIKGAGTTGLRPMPPSLRNQWQLTVHALQRLPHRGPTRSTAVIG
jgi:hypothetical protein